MGLHQLITTSQVVAFLGHVTYKVFDIPAGNTDLLAWSCHSICIMAVNLVHRARFSDSYIKNRLHWHSDTFLMHLCNTFYTADQHMTAITLSLDPLMQDLAPLSSPMSTYSTLVCIKPW